MKKALPLFLLCLLNLSCALKNKYFDYIKTSTFSKANYGVIITNYLESNISVKATVYDKYGNSISHCNFGLIYPNHTEVFRFYVDVSDLSDKMMNAYMRFEAFQGADSIPLDNNDTINFTDLKNNYTRCHFSKNSQYITHNVILNPEEQKSTSKIYDDTNNYVEFKLYDDLSWLKGKWEMIEGYGDDILVFENGTPFSKFDAYKSGTYSHSGFVVEWISQNDFSDSFYVNENKTELKTVHPWVMDPSVLIVTTYKKVD